MRKTAIAAALLLATATTAYAADKAAGWAKWVARADQIATAMEHAEGFKANIKTACSGVTGTVVGQGFQFPYWAQNLIQVCTVLKDDWIYANGKQQCGDVKRVIGNLNKAQPVAEAPQAEPLAKRMAMMMQSAYDAKCRK